MERKLLMSDFIVQASAIEKLQLSHMSLFLAIYHQWKISEFIQPIKITRQMLMNDSKIKSFATYSKCMTDLNDLGFITYKPSYHPAGSFVYWGNLISR